MTKTLQPTDYSKTLIGWVGTKRIWLVERDGKMVTVREG